MALEDGNIKLPEDRKPWGIQIDKYSTLKGRQSLAEALRIFAPYSTGQLFADPALNIDVRGRANKHIEEAAAAFINQTLRSFSDKGILTRDPLTQIAEITQALAAKYPEYGEFGLPMGEAFVLNEIKARVTYFLLTLVALNERAHRNRRHKEIPKAPKGYKIDTRSIDPVQTHYGFFQLIDNPETIMNYPGLDEAGIKMLIEVSTNYLALKKFCKPFFQGDVGTFNNPGNKTKEQLKLENDKIGPEVIARKKREIPLCTLVDEDLFVGKPTVFQFGPTTPDLHTFHSSLADVHLFEKDLGSIVADDPKIQSFLRTQGTAVQDLSLQIGNLPQLGIDRFRGDLTSFTMAPEVSKLLAGNSPNYELTRRRVLWYLAQLTCHQADVEDIFGVNFEKRKTGPRPHNSQDPSKPESPSHPGPAHPLPSVVDRNYPTSRVAHAVEETLEAVRQQAASRTPHTRLLPLIRRSSGEIIVCKPSEKAKGLAANHHVQLGDGLEILSTGEVIYPENMEKFLAALGAASLEEAIALDPENLSIRHETWIEGRQNEPGDVAQAVRAHVRATI